MGIDLLLIRCRSEEAIYVNGKLMNQAERLHLHTFMEHCQHEILERFRDVYIPCTLDFTVYLQNLKAPSMINLADYLEEFE